ncbi:MAG: phosphomannomutase/phosphoglucomutase [Kiritimatiellaeota bacterium]|nr:phosphomannomutase/phosphoglucomutase [Kiritimatiellota bacterium]
MPSIFKAYDIRGVYGADLTDAAAYDIGRAFATFLGGNNKTIVVGRDCRPHSEPLFIALSNGLRDQGFNVTDLGYASTPMTYHACGKLHADGSVMITASHNTKEWNGFKLCRENAIPVSGATGIEKIEKIILEKNFAPRPETRGALESRGISAEYAEFIHAFPRPAQKLRVAADYANGMGILEARPLQDLLDIDPLFDTLDGTFPNHEANPLEAHTLKALQEKMRAGHHAFGVAFDGDADRVGFLDETGAVIPMDFITALIAREMLALESGPVYYDLRSSRVVRETIASCGGTPLMSRVGHSFIKQQMREHNAAFAGELSGHYYFKANHTSESAALAVLLVANIAARAGAPLSRLVEPLRVYAQSGEINSKVSRDPGEILEEIKQTHAAAGANVYELDGVSVEYPGWWFNVRRSNTEPLVRLNLEAASPEFMRVKRDEILAVIRK